MYEYNAMVVSVYDGDTLTAILDLGFGITINKAKLRLIGVNTPELRGGPDEREAAIAARDYVREQILGRQVRIKSRKKGKYGRYLVELWRLDWDGEDERESLNAALIRLGHAEKYDC